VVVDDFDIGVPAKGKRIRHPEVLAVLHGEPRRMGHKRPLLSFETPRKSAAPQDDDGASDHNEPRHGCNSASGNVLILALK
jgi:hypothetical protein